MEEELNYLSEKIATINEKIGLLEYRGRGKDSPIMKNLKRQERIYSNILSALTISELNKSK
jgi:hypothetical protein